MIDTFQIAVDGVTPKFSPWRLALQGFWFDVEIVVPPIPPTTDNFGGGRWKDSTPWETAQPYIITVRVRYKDKTWEQKQSVSLLVARSLEKVLVSFRRMSSKLVNIATKFKALFAKDIKIIVKQKD